MYRISNILLTAALMLGLSVQLSAQHDKDIPKLKEVKGKKLLEDITPLQHKKGLWGYANSEGKFTIKPVFNEACPFEANLARVCVDGKWGTISNTGIFVVTPSYDGISEYSADSLAIVKSYEKYGIINAKGYKLQPVSYNSIDYADFGYIVREGDRYGTVDKFGNTMFKPQFDRIVPLEKHDTLDLFFKDGKWGVMRAGREILTHKWDTKLVLLQNGIGNMPNLYLAAQNRHVGVVIPTGEYVVPCIYDDIVPASSGQYFITRIEDQYGAINLKMEDLVAPILESKPYIGEDIYRVYNDGIFYCVNFNGAIDFRHCAELYNMFKPEEYITTTAFPQWAKSHLVEENLLSRQDCIDNSRRVSELMNRCGFDVENAKNEKDIPEGIALSFPASDNERYGILDGGRFSRSSGTVTDYESGYHNVLYKVNDKEVYFVSDPSSGEYYISTDGYLFQIDEILEKYGVKQHKSLYPKNYALLSDDRIAVQMAFVRTQAEAGEPLIETDQYKLPTEFAVKIFNGSPNPSVETSAAIVFHVDSLASLSFVQMPDSNECRMVGSRFGGFYTYAPSTYVANMEHPLRRFDRNGVLDWEYRPAYGEVFYDIEETENFIYLCGSTINGPTSGVEIPMLVQLSKRGEVVRKMTKDYPAARFKGLRCSDYLIYVRTEFMKDALLGDEYYPHYILEDMQDNFGVSPNCVWEQWGTAMIGGFGLVSTDGKWLSSPILSTEQVCTSFDWEYSGFVGDCLIIRHMGKYGVVDKSGDITVEPKYDLLEFLNNPSFIKAQVDDLYGVIDTEGRVIVPVEYDYVGNMSEDIIVVSKDGLYGCYDKEGKLVVPMESEEIREYVGGMARIRMNRKFGFIDKKGEILVNPFSDEVENFAEGCALVTIKDKKGFVTLQGDWITPPMYDNGSSFSGGLAALSLNGKYGYIDKAGEFVIPMQFTEALPFNPDCRLAPVAWNGKWGVMNAKGESVLPTIYDEIVVCSDGYIYAKKDGKCGIFSNRGKEVYPMKCDSIDYSGREGLFTNGAVTARINGELIRIDYLGNTVYPYAKFATQN